MIKPFELPIKPTIYSQHEAIGVFHRLYEIEGLKRRERDILARWLCQNCTENFIMTELSSTIIAGGTANLKSSFAHRSSNRDVLLKHQVKLHEPDVMLFDLCWLTAPNTVLYS
jgi:hypothetical protein